MESESDKQVLFDEIQLLLHDILDHSISGVQIQELLSSRNTNRSNNCIDTLARIFNKNDICRIGAHIMGQRLQDFGEQGTGVVSVETIGAFFGEGFPFVHICGDDTGHGTKTTMVQIDVSRIHCEQFQELVTVLWRQWRKNVCISERQKSKDANGACQRKIQHSQR